METGELRCKEREVLVPLGSCESSLPIEGNSVANATQFYRALIVRGGKGPGDGCVRCVSFQGDAISVCGKSHLQITPCKGACSDDVNTNGRIESTGIGTLVTNEIQRNVEFACLRAGCRAIKAARGISIFALGAERSRRGEQDDKGDEADVKGRSSHSANSLSDLRGTGEGSLAGQMNSKTPIPGTKVSVPEILVQVGLWEVTYAPE